MSGWRALVVPPVLDKRTLELFDDELADIGLLHIGRYGQAGAGPLGVMVEPPALTDAVLRRLLDLMVALNRRWLFEHPECPPLYASGVRYRHERVDTFEQWLTVPWLWASVLRGDYLADCKGLCAWRVAELQLAGEKRARCVWDVQIIGGRVVVHIRARRNDGSKEDPSALLGMGREEAAPWIF